MALSVAKRIRIRIPVGDETVVFVVRQPTADEQNKFLTNRFRTKGRKLDTNLHGARVQLIDTILVDVENAQFEAADGSIKDITAQTQLSDEDRNHCAALLGAPVSTWKDLINPSWKSSAAMYFEEAQPEAGEGD